MDLCQKQISLNHQTDRQERAASEDKMVISDRITRLETGASRVAKQSKAMRLQLMEGPLAPSCDRFIQITLYRALRPGLRARCKPFLTRCRQIWAYSSHPVPCRITTNGKKAHIVYLQHRRGGKQRWNTYASPRFLSQLHRPLAVVRDDHLYVIFAFCSISPWIGPIPMKRLDDHGLLLEMG